MIQFLTFLQKGQKQINCCQERGVNYQGALENLWERNVLHVDCGSCYKTGCLQKLIELCTERECM